MEILFGESYLSHILCSKLIYNFFENFKFYCRDHTKFA